MKTILYSLAILAIVGANLIGNASMVAHGFSA